jgi:hypothetical protein
MPDLCLPLETSRFGAMFVELKSRTGRLRPSQKERLAMLSAAGNYCVVCRDAETALRALILYIHGKPLLSNRTPGGWYELAADNRQ